MTKSLGILVGGIFIGAVGVEVVRRKKPECLDKFYTKIREMASEAKGAFVNGYRNATTPQEAAKAGS